MSEALWERQVSQKLKDHPCPNCGGHDIAIIVYGQLPVGDARFNHLARVKLLVPRGCFISEEDLYCNDCESYWKSGKGFEEFGRGGLRVNKGGPA
jgi:hypothetical protein